MRSRTSANPSEADARFVADRSPSSSGAIRRAGLSGIAWTGMATILSQLLFAIVSLVVAGRIGPEEFALYGIAAVVLNVQYVATLGLGQALIYFQAPGRRIRDDVDAASVATWVTGALLCVVIAAMAPTVASLLGDAFVGDRSDVILALRLASLALLCGTIESVPVALLERKLQFRRRAEIDASSAIAYAVSVGVMLACGLGVWSIILGRVFQAALRLSAFAWTSPVKPRIPPRVRSVVLGQLLRYGIVLNGIGLLAFAIENVDTLIVARVAGREELGAYVVAFTLTMFASTFLIFTVGRVFYPLYSTVRDDLSSRKQIFADSIHLVGVVMLPLTVCFLTIGPTLFVEVFGSEWIDIAPLLRILAVYSLLRAVGVACVTLLNAEGRARVPLSCQLANLAISLSLAWALSGLGAPGIALAFTLGRLVFVSLVALGARHAWSLAAIRRAAPAAASAVTALLAVLIARWAYVPLGSGLAGAALFAVAYLAALLGTDAQARTAIEHIHGSRGGRWLQRNR